MKPMPQTAPTQPVGVLLKRRLKQLEKTSAELAEAVQLPLEYIEALIDGTRRPPQPGWTDLYDRMTQYLKFGRNDLAAAAVAERAALAQAPRRADPRVRELMLALCEPGTAASFQPKPGKPHAADAMAQRLLEVVQASVRHDTLAYRATMRPGRNHVTMRGRVFEFLDATIDLLNVSDFEEFVRPRVASWDVDRDSGVLRVIFSGREQRPAGPPTTTRPPGAPTAAPIAPPAPPAAPVGRPRASAKPAAKAKVKSARGRSAR
jgi:hypothetical protein